MFPQPMNWIEGDYLALCVLPDGKLLITLTSEGWNNKDKFLNDKKFYRAWFDMFLDIMADTGYAYTFSVAEWGMMSDAPGFSDAVFVLDDGSVDVRHFWYYNLYQIKDELQELYTKGYIIFDYFECEE